MEPHPLNPLELDSFSYFNILRQWMCQNSDPLDIPFRAGTSTPSLVNELQHEGLPSSHMASPHRSAMSPPRSPTPGRCPRRRHQIAAKVPQRHPNRVVRGGAVREPERDAVTSGHAVRPIARSISARKQTSPPARDRGGLIASRRSIWRGVARLVVPGALMGPRRARRWHRARRPPTAARV